MKITKSKISETESNINLELEKNDYFNQFELKLKELKKKANLKGFRPGMVPIQLLKNMYGKSVLLEEINKIVSEKINNYIKEQKIKIIGEPIADSDKIDEIKINEIDKFTFNFKIGHLSDFSIKPYKKTQKFTLYNIKIDKKTVDETINNLKIQYADINNLKEITLKSSVYCEFEFPDEKKKGILNIETLDKKESKKLIGCKLNESLLIDLKKLAKNDLNLISQIVGNLKDINDVPNKINIKIENIIERSPAKLKPTFFDKIFGQGKIKTLKDFNKEIEKSIEFNYLRESEYLLNREIEKNLLKNNKISIPKKYVEDWIISNNDEKTSKKLLGEDFDKYCEQIRWSYIVDDIIDSNEIKIDNSEIEEMAKNQIQNQLFASGMQNMSKDIDKFVNNYLKHNGGENYLKIFNELKANKVFNLIKDQVSINKKSITFDKFKLIAKEI